MKQADSIRPTSDAREQCVRQFSGLRKNLLTRFTPNHALKFAHHKRIGMRTQGATEQVIGVVNVCDPVAQSFIDGVLQCAGSRVHSHHFGPQQSHSENIELLPAHIFRAHVNHALKTEQCADGCGRDSMLARASLGDHALFAHAAC